MLDSQSPTGLSLRFHSQVSALLLVSMVTRAYKVLLLFCWCGLQFCFPWIFILDSCCFIRRYCTCLVWIGSVARWRSNLQAVEIGSYLLLELWKKRRPGVIITASFLCRLVKENIDTHKSSQIEYRHSPN